MIMKVYVIFLLNMLMKQKLSFFYKYEYKSNFKLLLILN